MPLTRYTISNEFKFTDPDFHTCNSGKNDPHAHLEGVAVAGMVGLLRQLGDLAQFAADIFHDLHEQVMATATRSRGLMERTKRLEADVPSIENYLLSQTDHTEFYYNAGVDWHPQMSINEKLFTQGGMPRFIRDYYEECHAPPKLFLLDKFDVGGTGTCLKRFTDPSFFSTHQTTSEAGKLEAQIDWRTWKSKKKGSRWKHGDTSEVSTASRSKLHQLLLEDRTGNERKIPTRHVSLKKRNLDSSRSSKSYMHKFRQTMSPEHPAAPGLGSVAEESKYLNSMDRETKSLTSVQYSNDFSNKHRLKDLTSHLYGGYIEKELVVTVENGHGNDAVCSSSDGIASAREYYTDALADVDSEVEIDNSFRHMKGNEYRCKKEVHFYSMPKQGTEQFLDYQSVDNTSDDGNASFMLETSSSLLHGLSKYGECGTAMEHRDRKAESFPACGDVNSISACGEFPDGYNHDMCNARKSYERYWVDAAASALLGLNVDYANLLSTKNEDHAVAYSLSGYQDTAGHLGSNKLSYERKPADGMAVKGDSDYKYDHSPSINGDSGQMSVSLSYQQEVGSQCSSSISPRYLEDPNSSCEMNKMEEFRRSQEVGFKQYAQDLKPLGDNDGQVSKRLHLDTVIDSTSLRLKDWNSELTNHSSPSPDASSQIHSSQEQLLHPEEAVLKPSDFTSGINGSFHNSSLGGEVKKHEAQTGERLLHTSIHNPARFPLDADSIPLAEDKTDVPGQHSHYFTTEEVKTDFSIIHPMTHVEVSLQSIKPLLEYSGSAFDAPAVPMHHIDQSPEDSKSHRKTEHVAQSVEEKSKTEHAARSPEEKIIKCIETPGPQIRNEEHCNQDVKSSNHEDGIFDEKPTVKLPRPRYPLTKSVSALDRSKLKKLTPRIQLEMPNVESGDALDRRESKKVAPRSRPETPNADARDSLLEVIRTKSFNLKPTPAPTPKPIIRAPTMNLKVSAILEKANRIRQATAGSDEDNDWSDE